MTCLACPRLRRAWKWLVFIILPAFVLASEAAELSMSLSQAQLEDNLDIKVAAGEITDSLQGTAVNSLEGLGALFRDEQARYLWITPPDANFPLCQDGGVVVFDPSAFPDSFNRMLVGKMQHNCPLYALTIAEDPVTRGIVFSNGEGKEIARLMQEEGYNPYWLLEWRHPDLYAGYYGSEEIKRLEADYDPSRVQITLNLLPSDYVETYALAMSGEQTRQTASRPDRGGISPLMMYQGPAVSNLQFVAIERMTNGMKLTLAYPAAFTNDVEFFTCSDLIGFWWSATATTNVSMTDNWMEWTDTNAMAQAVRFYAAGDAVQDTDQDGLTDAREKYLYHTSATTNDTDGDGLSDEYEIMTLDTDPNNSKTNKPIVGISYPANESRKVWLP